MTTEHILTSPADLKDIMPKVAVTSGRTLTALARSAGTGKGLVNVVNGSVDQKDVFLGPVLAILEQAGYEVVIRRKPRREKQRARMDVARSLARRRGGDEPESPVEPEPEPTVPVTGDLLVDAEAWAGKLTQAGAART